MALRLYEAQGRVSQREHLSKSKTAKKCCYPFSRSFCVLLKAYLCKLIQFFFSCLDPLTVHLSCRNGILFPEFMSCCRLYD